MPGLQLRPMVPDEMRYVGATWSRSMRPPFKPYDGFYKLGDRGLSNQARGHSQALLVDALVAEGNVLVAEAVDAPGTVLGWVCWLPNPLTVHFVFVVETGRRNGLGRALYHAATKGEKARHSHTTPDGRALLEAIR